MKLWKLTPWPMAIILLVFWRSAEADRVALERLLEEERDRVRQWRRYADHKSARASNLTQDKCKLIDLLGVVAAAPDRLDAAQWAELRKHAEGLVDGGSWGPLPHAQERVELPQGWDRLRAAVERVLSYKPRVPAQSGHHADLEELGAALVAAEEPQTRREPSSPPASPVAASVAPGPLQSAALAELVEGCRSWKRSVSYQQTIDALDKVAAAIDHLDDLRLAPPGEVADPPTPVAPFGWLELTGEQRAEAQAHVDGLRGIAPPSGLPFRVLGTPEARATLLRLASCSSPNARGIIADELIGSLLAHRDHLAAQVTDLQVSNTTLVEQQRAQRTPKQSTTAPAPDHEAGRRVWSSLWHDGEPTHWKEVSEGRQQMFSLLAAGGEAALIAYYTVPEPQAVPVRRCAFDGRVEGTHPAPDGGWAWTKVGEQDVCSERCAQRLQARQAAWAPDSAAASEARPEATRPLGGPW